MLTLSLNRASAVEFALCYQVCTMGFFRSLKRTKVLGFSGNHDLSLPATALRFVDSEKSAGVIPPSFALIRYIAAIRHISEVVYCVVTSIAIDVIYNAVRMRVIDIKPSKTMGWVSPAFHSDAQIAIHFATCELPNLDVVADHDTPSEYASLWVVVKQFAQACCGKIGLSHDTVPSLIGQRPASVTSTGGLRYFITRACSCATGITKCLHKAAIAAVAVCIPANHRRISNPSGALTPFNAL